MSTLRIAVIAGDGIGPEVIHEGILVLEQAAAQFGFKLALTHFDYGAERWLKEGVGLPKGAIESFRADFDAIYFGALGDPRIPDMAHGRDILLGLRFGLDLYINMRPVTLMHEGLCPLKNKRREDLQFVIFRENTEDSYLNTGGFHKHGTPDEIAINESINTYKGVERIIRAAFEHADRKGLTKVCMADKHNVLRYAHDLWFRVFKRVAAEYPRIEHRHLYIDTLAMEMVLHPESFQVIVTSNMFGDIVTDLGAALVGGLGVAASGNIHPGVTSLFEPVHGSAPPLAGKKAANPIGAILTAAMMLEHLGQPIPAQAIERAVVQAITDGKVTRDIGGSLTTPEAGAVIRENLKAW